MGREATVLRWKNGISNTTNVKYPISNENKKEDITYRNILNAFVRGKERTFEIAYTIEFYPEEGKYHFTGHRNCGVSYDPEQDRKLGTTCPKCGRELTVGVMHRVEELADFEEKNYEFEKDENGVTWVKDPTGVRPPYVSLVPLLEILKEALNSGLTSQKVIAEFDKLVTHFGTEHEVLFRVHKDELVKVTSEKIVEAIYKVRDRSINIKPGFDGEYGIVSIWDERSESMPPAGLF
jgi:PHP family Zn ribbon phosphoesterase